MHASMVRNSQKANVGFTRMFITGDHACAQRPALRILPTTNASISVAVACSAGVLPIKSSRVIFVCGSGTTAPSGPTESPAPGTGPPPTAPGTEPMGAWYELGRSTLRGLPLYLRVEGGVGEVVGRGGKGCSVWVWVWVVWVW